MRGGNNLVIGVRADVSKLKADLALAQAELLASNKELNSKAKSAAALPSASPLRATAEKEVRAAADAHDLLAQKVVGLKNNLSAVVTEHNRLNSAAAGVNNLATGYSAAAGHADRFRNGVRGVSDEHGKLNGSGIHNIAQGYGAAATSAGRVKDELKGIGAEHGNLGKVTNAVQSMTGSFGQLHGMLLGLGVVGAGLAVKNTVGEVTENLAKIENISKGTGMPNDIVATILELTRQSSGSEDVGGAIIQFATNLGDAQKKARAALGVAQGPIGGEAGVNVIRGDQGGGIAGLSVMRGDQGPGASGVNVLKGNQKPLGEDDPFSAFGLRALNFQGTDGLVKAWDTAAKRFVELQQKDPGRTGRQGALLWGEDDINKMSQTIRRSGTEGIQNIANQMKAAGLIPPPEAYTRMREYQASVGLVKSEFAAMKREAVVSLYPALSAALKGTSEEVKHLGVEFSGTFKEAGVAIHAVVKDILGLFSGRPPQTWFIKEIQSWRTAATVSFAGITTGLDGIARGLNFVFNSNISGKGILIALAIGKITGAFKLLSGALALIYLNPVTITLTAIAGAALLIYANWDKIGPVFQKIWDLMQRFGTWVAGQFAKFWTDPIGYIKDAFAGLLTWLTEQMQAFTKGIESVAKAAVSAAKSISNAIGGGSAAPSAGTGGGYSSSTGGGLDSSALAGGASVYASGGYISGAGSGTSDSIPARLSNGEYVVNAVSTSRFRPLLDHINTAGYALGGLVGRSLGFSPSIPSFAGGGLVGGGSSFGTVNLTFGGQTASLNVSNADGFGQLSRIARTEQRTSAGAKPSWYGS